MIVNREKGTSFVKNKISIAIDGPAAAGKSTIAQKIANQLSYLYIDTSAMYRALTVEAINQEVHPEDEQALVRLFQKINIHLEAHHQGQKVFVNDVDVTSEIREQEVTNGVSYIVKHP